MMKQTEDAVARLRQDFPTIFGDKALLTPLTRQHVNNFVRAEEKKKDEAEIPSAAKRGRKAALPESLTKCIVETLSAVILSRGRCWSCNILRPVAIGVITKMGYGHTFKEGKGLFSCSLEYLRQLLKTWKFRRVKPCRDPRKVPRDGVGKVRDMALRVAYFVFTYDIPAELVQNWDQSGILFLQQKGSTWVLKGELGESQHHGDKQQFTATFGSMAAGDFLACQVVFQGKTSGSLAKFKDFGNYVYASIIAAGVSYGGWVFPQSAPEKLKRGIRHLAVTKNHWSNAETSINLLDNVAVPAYLEAKKKLGLKPYHPAIILLDVWWGWMDSKFLAHIKQRYPWLKVCYVPACCTPIGQPQDGGTIAKVKALLRQMFNSWVLEKTMKHMDSGAAPDQFDLDLSAPTCKTNLTMWLARACAVVPKELVLKMWKKTGLLRAWHLDFQREAVEQSRRLFPNMDKPDLSSATAPGAGEIEEDPTLEELRAIDQPTEAQDAEDTVGMLRECGVEVPDVNTSAIAAPPSFWGPQDEQVALGSLD